MREDKKADFSAHFDFLSFPHKKGDFFMSEITRRSDSSSAKVLKLCMAALFCALAVASTFVMHFKVMFLTFDAKDAVIAIAGLLFGPIYSLVISLAVSLIEFITIGDAGFWGFLMDFLSTALFSTLCALIYKYKKNIKGAIIGLALASVSMTAFMLLFNLFIVPIYTPNFTTAAVAQMVPTLFLPFNVTKAVLNSALVLILYKPISRAMKAAKVIRSSDVGLDADKKSTKAASGFSKKDAVILAIGLALVAISVLVFIFVLNGEFMLVD